MTLKLYDLAAAEDLYLAALTEAEGLGQDQLVAMIEQNLGAMANIRGDLDDAVRRYEAALRHYDTAGDPLSTAGVLTNLGMAYVDLARWPAAEDCFAARRIRAADSPFKQLE